MFPSPSQATPNANAGAVAAAPVSSQYNGSDAMLMDDEPASRLLDTEGEQRATIDLIARPGGAAARNGRRGQPANLARELIPQVPDETAEQLRDLFEEFLET